MIVYIPFHELFKYYLCIIKIFKPITYSYVLVNKMAQRALGRSPEENVKAQGEAIYRGPLMLFTKYW